MRKFSKRMSCVWKVRGTIYGFGCVSKSVFSYDDDDDDTVTMSERLHGSASQGVMVSERLDNSASPDSRDQVGSDQSQFGGGGAIGGITPYNAGGDATGGITPRNTRVGIIRVSLLERGREAPRVSLSEGDRDNIWSLSNSRRTD